MKTWLSLAAAAALASFGSAALAQAVVGQPAPGVHRHRRDGQDRCRWPTSRAGMWCWNG
jgi:hypothetical protein